MQAFSSSFSRRGVMLVIASPSGAGKTSISRAILREDRDISLSVSVTTRQRRSNEVHGQDYHFIDPTRFEQMRRDDELLESAQVHGNFYGTPKADVNERLSRGQDVLFDIDWQGTQQLLKKCRADMVSVFILPPSIAQLKSRLEHRAQDSTETIAQRLKNAREEMSHWQEYDYVLVNTDLDQSVKRVTTLLESARMARQSKDEISIFIKELQEQINSL